MICGYWLFTGSNEIFLLDCGIIFHLRTLTNYLHVHIHVHVLYIHHIAGFIGERFNLAILKKKKRQIKIPFPLETPFNIMGMHGPTTRGKIAKI